MACFVIGFMWITSLHRFPINTYFLIIVSVFTKYFSNMGILAPCSSLVYNPFSFHNKFFYHGPLNLCSSARKKMISGKLFTKEDCLMYFRCHKVGHSLNLCLNSSRSDTINLENQYIKTISPVSEETEMTSLDTLMVQPTDKELFSSPMNENTIDNSMPGSEFSAKDANENVDSLLSKNSDNDLSTQYNSPDSVSSDGKILIDSVDAGDTPSLVTGQQSEVIPDSQVLDIPSFDAATQDSAEKNPLSQFNFTPQTTTEPESMPDSSIENAQNSLKLLISNIEEALNSSIDNVSNVIKDVSSDVSTSILNSKKISLKALEDAVPKIPVTGESSGKPAISYSIDIWSPFRTGTPANSALKRIVAFVEDSTGFVWSKTTNLIGEAYYFTKGSLPPDVQTQLEGIEKKAAYVLDPLGASAQQIYAIIIKLERQAGLDPENPIILAVVFIGGTVGIGILYWQYNFGGYSGDVSSKEAADLLRKEQNIMLIDIRPEELRERDGIPDLRRGLRSKFAAVELPKVEEPVKKLLKNGKEIDDVLIATIIRNLRVINGRTKVIVMDANGSQSKRVARSLRKFGIKRSYRLKGGFQSWIEDGHRVKEMINETPLAILKEETEAILEETRPSPGAILAACVGVVAAVNALIEWEKALQLIGFLGIAQILYKRINSYESSEDLKSDIRALFRPFAAAGQVFMFIAQKIEPNNLQLVTTPSTTAVQNRVLQAAAKHDSLSSQPEETQDTKLTAIPDSDNDVTHIS